MNTKAPKLPELQAVTLDANKTALLVLDLTELCADPKEECSTLVPGMTRFLAKARKAKVFIAFTIMAIFKGKPVGKVFSGFNAQPSEPVLFPNGFNKFEGGELEEPLKQRGIDTVIVTGFRSNIAVMYTATHAARALNYRVIVPVDGLAALTEYEHEYTLYQLSVLPGGASERFTFTTLDQISFK
ncbi:MAG: isochorismatase family protein [Dehalococcoidia bacterium]|nr:isochorismatase family protein [Dehalococcoidia bacterium]